MNFPGDWRSTAHLPPDCIAFVSQINIKNYGSYFPVKLQ